MVESSTQEWFLEVEGHKTGPFATDQILGLFADQEILGTARIILTAPGSEWTTVSELASLVHPPPAASPSLGAKPFVPPPRPAELASTSNFNLTNAPKPVAVSKPELSLLDALRVTKERRSHHPPSKAKEAESTFAEMSSFNLIARLQVIPTKTWLIGVTLIALCTATWGLTLYIKMQPPPLAAQPAAAPVSETRAAIPPPPSTSHQPPAALPPPAIPQARTSAALSVAPPKAISQPAAPQKSSAHNTDAERARENERRDHDERDRDQERERDLANNNAPSQIVAPMESETQGPGSPPPVPEQGLDATGGSPQSNPDGSPLNSPASPPLE